MTSLEAWFYGHGVRVAAQPGLTIVLSLLVTGLSVGGLARFTMLLSYVDTWVPGSAVRRYMGVGLCGT